MHSQNVKINTFCPLFHSIISVQLAALNELQPLFLTTKMEEKMRFKYFLQV